MLRIKNYCDKTMNVDIKTFQITYNYGMFVNTFCFMD